MNMLLLFITWLVLMFIGIPISFSLIIAVSGYFLIHGELLIAVPQRLLAGSSNFTTLAIPFFVLAAQIMNIGGITDRIFHLAKAWVGHMRGSLGHVNVLASIIFAGKSGSGAADVAGMGMIEMEIMIKSGFDEDFSAGISAASATIGPVIPPSIPMVLYGSLSGASVGALFMGGYIPGFMMAASMFVLVYIYAVKRNYPVFPKATWKERFVAFKETFWALMTPVILFAGIFLGIVTPTEAAVVTVFYGFILSAFIYRVFNMKDFMAVVLDTVETVGTIIMLFAAAGLFGWTLSRAQIPQLIASALLSISTNPLIILLIMNVFLLALGLFVEGLAALAILVPIILPVLKQTGIDPVHFGVIMVMNITIGAITPPVGTFLFILSNVAKMPLERVIRGALPWLVPLIIVLLICTIFPETVLFIPRLAGLME